MDVNEKYNHSLISFKGVNGEYKIELIASMENEQIIFLNVIKGGETVYRKYWSQWWRSTDVDVPEQARSFLQEWLNYSIEEIEALVTEQAVRPNKVYNSGFSGSFYRNHNPTAIILGVDDPYTRLKETK